MASMLSGLIGLGVVVAKFIGTVIVHGAGICGSLAL